MITVNELMFDVSGVQAVRLPLVNLGSLMDQMVYRLPGCSDVMIRKELQNTARTFCKATAALSVKIDNDLVAEQFAYNLQPDLSAFIHTLLGVTVDGYLLSSYQFSIADGEPVILTLDEGAFTDDNLIVSAYVSLIPHIGCEDFPDWFLSMWGDAIIAGTFSKIFGMERKPWTDMTAAKDEAISFQNHMNDATVRRLTGGRQMDLTARNPTAWL